MPPLHLRQPDLRWLVIAGLAALFVHGLVWFLARYLVGDGDVLVETRRQMALALGWMVCALVLWKMRAPLSRLHAVAGVFLCAVAVTVLGSLAALAKLILIDGYPATHELMSSFTLLSIVLLVAHLALALPAMLVLQGIALSRRD